MAEKKEKPFSATQYSMKYLRKQGFEIWKTEQTVRAPNPVVPGTFKIWKRDLFNFADLVGVRVGTPGTLYVQTTTVPHQADRIAKVANLAVVQTIVKAGNTVHVHGWAKKGPRGGRKVWQITVTQIGFDVDGMLTERVLDTQAVDDEQPGIDFEDEQF